MTREITDPLVPASFDPLSTVLVFAAALQVFLFLAAAVSVLRSERLTRNGRLLWLLVLVALPFLGAIAWFLWGRHARLDRDLVE